MTGQHGPVTSGGAMIIDGGTTELAMIVVDGTAAPPWIVVLTGLAAVAAVVPRWTWRNSGHLDTIVHEGGHAFVAYLLGHWVFGVWLFSDTSGLTGTYGRPSRLVNFLVSAAGYAAPPAFGLGAAVLLNADHITATLILALVALVALFLVVRNRFGILIVTGASSVIILALCSASASTQSALACFLTWFLLLSGPRAVLDLHRARKKGSSSSDADMMAELTGIPGVFWVLGFGALAMVCLFHGTRLLLS
ncbi:M50 family metallopeptidase [Frankia sp. Cr2]|uniref:M50 family metallopeptidase n=1 Tax=Frankia sp. Cr2 TaxID=3073932 RepID=UPI002AD53DF7|nr:M50 family metallopeptidase [Frankia sp. Cr2]